ncbi:hypothetical protein C0995_015268 [Termitomyces sp. Mi166|nr:hypothetical protein C0995_015268 [Termitomyces sp. Mi166\
MRISPPERQRRSSGALPTAYKPRKTTTEHPKRYSAYSMRSRGRKPFRNSRDTENPLRRTISPDHQYRFDPDDPTFCNSDPGEVPQSDDDEQDFEDDENSLFHWEEESTLFSDLLDASPNEPKDQEYDELVNLLQPAFSERGRELKREIAETIVPTVNRVKDLYGQIDSKVDDNFAKGIITFNKACKELEILVMRGEDEVKDALSQFKRINEELFAQLKEAYAARDRLWADFEKAINETEPMLEVLRDLPANVERVVGNSEKQCRALEKEDANTMSAVEKKIKGLLAKA